MHPGVSARPTTWTLLRVLCAYSADEMLGLMVMRLILRYVTVLRAISQICYTIDERDTQVLSVAMQLRAVAVIDFCLTTFPTTNDNTVALRTLTSLKSYLP